MKRLIAVVTILVFTGMYAFGQNNTADITQAGDDHEASIEQLGELNEAFVDQTDGGSGSTGNAVADINQDGSGNFANVRQVAFFGQLFGDSYANITQIGDNNRVEGANPGDAFLQSNVGGVVDVRMQGNNNVLSSLRGEAQKNGNEFLLDVLGSDNNVAMAQEFGFGDVAITGNTNNVSLYQMAGANWDQSVYNNADVTVDGDLNTIDIKQDGLANDSFVDLLGSSNNSTITQTTDFNTASVTVNGSGNTSTITQN